MPACEVLARLIVLALMNKSAINEAVKETFSFQYSQKRFLSRLACPYVKLFRGGLIVLRLMRPPPLNEEV